MNKKQLRKKLALMLATLKKPRKYFCEVEFLESTGTQYIDTGYSINTDTDEIIVNYTNASTQNNKWLFGEYESNANFGITSYKQSESSIAYAYNGLIVRSKSTQYDTKHTLVANSDGLYNDGVKVSNFKSYTATWNIYLFALNYTGTSVGDYFGYGKIYSYKHKRNNVIIRDLIPVLDWNMTPCMYDRVSEQLFYNQGTGSFVAGRQIHQVEYLESTGTQYIDTGVQYIQGDTIELNGRFVNPEHDDGLVVMIPWNTPSNSRFMFAIADSGNISSFTMSYNSLPGGSNNPQPRYLDDKFHTWHYEGLTLTIDDGLVSLTNTENYNQGSGTLRLFYRYNRACETAIKYYKQWRDNTLIRDFIPAIDETGKAYMFDRVSHTIYDNAGTGAFNYPPVELEYLESSGTQYIDTGYVPNQDTEIKTDAKFNNLNANNAIFQVDGTSTSNKACGLTIAGNGKLVYAFGNKYQLLSDYDIDTNKHNFYIDKNSLYIDDTLIYTIEETSFSSTSTLPLFAWKRNGNILFNTESTIYNLKIWDNGTLVRNFIPVYYNGSAGMWDKVNSVFYPSASGSFVAGAVKEPEYE